MASSPDETNRRLSKFVCFLERHANVFKERTDLLDTSWWICFFISLFTLCVILLTNLMWFSSSQSEVAFAIYFIQQIFMTMFSVLLVQEYHISWYANRDNCTTYLDHKERLKCNFNLNYDDLRRVHSNCRDLILKTVPDAQQDRMIAKFNEWALKLKK